MAKAEHYSVGAIIRDDQGRYLLIDRATEPLGFAGIAGHIEPGEQPQHAVAREIEEESGLKLAEAKLLAERFLDWNWCNKGVTGHHWYLFECSVSGTPHGNARETKSVGWYNLEQLKKLNLEPVWQYWFKEMKII